jgi:mono/diheme cytochrome c family protein
MANTPTSRRMGKVFFAAALTLAAMSLVFAAREKRTWSIPDDAKQRKNPLQFSPAALQAARELYLDNCAQCHGEHGKGDGPEATMHDPLPADLSNRKFNEGLTDGEIFYQISEGKKPMPAFKRRFTEEQRWQLVFLVRSFAAPVPTAAPPQPAPANPEDKSAKPQPYP